jgi:hypothetical protein
MISPRLSAVAFASVALLTSALADTVELKSGAKIEGKITSETDTQLTIEIKSGGIVDEQTVNKADVLNVAKASPDEAAYAVLKTIKLGANSLPTVAQYDTYLGHLKTFVSQYPNSAHKDEIEKLAADFEAEKTRVADGEIKLAGKWLGKEEVQRERYQINGAIAADFLKEQAARNDVIGALNTFDVLEKQYPGSRGYVDSVETVKRLLPSLKQQADAYMVRLPAEKAAREKALAGAAGLNKIELQKEHDQEKQGIEAALALAKRQNVKWPPFLPRSEEAMKRISELAKQDILRLSSFDPAKPQESFKLASEARAALDSKDFTLAEQKLRSAQAAWSRNELLPRLNRELSEARTAAAQAIAAQAEAARAAEVAKAAAEAERKAAEAKKAEEASRLAVSSASQPAEDEPNKLPFRIMLAVVIGGVAFAGWKAYSSLRKKANEVLE